MLSNKKTLYVIIIPVIASMVIVTVNSIVFGQNNIPRDNDDM